MLLKVTLAEQEIILKVKNKAAEELIEVVGAESEKVSKEKAFGEVFCSIVIIFGFCSLKVEQWNPPPLFMMVVTEIFNCFFLLLCDLVTHVK